MSCRAALISVVAVVAFGACGSTHAADRTHEPSTTTVAARAAPDTTTTMPAYESVTAQAIVPHLFVFSGPSTHTPARVLDNPWLVNPAQPATAVPQVFLVESRRPDGWVRVLLPVRPNGTSGWVRARDVTLSPVLFKIRIELGVHRITVFQQGRVVYRGPVADGAPATPTPVGHYYIRVLIKAPDPNTVYGPFAYGLSSHSDALTSF